MTKRPFDIDRAMARIGEAVRPFAKAALFELADEDFGSAFELLVACIISIRTYDETTLVCARRLFELARTPEAIGRLSPGRIDEAIGQSTFHEPKARQIREIARRIVAEHGGELPCEFEVLTSFAGVGPKCANLVLGIACGEARIGVDVHVHRVTNRWGSVSLSSRFH
jgi:endonuclease-3